MEQILNKNSLLVQNNDAKKQRDIGCELLRIIYMFFIVVIHILGFGKLKVNAGEYIMPLQVLSAISACSVNIFVIISGYYMVKSKFSIQKLIRLWFQVLFYSLLTYFMSIMFKIQGFNIIEFGKACLPIIMKYYYFFSVYFLLMLLSPLLNIVIHNMTKKMAITFYCLALVIVYICVKFPIDEAVGIGYGQNLIWFTLVYMLGGGIRHFNVSIKKSILLVGYFVSLLLIFGCYIGEMYDFHIILEFIINRNTRITSPLVIINTICIFMLMKDIKSNNKFINKIICKISSTTFACYLLHESRHLRDFLYNNILKTQNLFNTSTAIFYVLLYALLIFAVCMVIDLIRQSIFFIIEKLIYVIKAKKQKA